MSEEETQIQVKNEEKGHKNQRYLKIFAVALAFFVGIILFFYAKENPEFPVGWIVTIIILAVLISSGIWNYYKIRDKISDTFSDEKEKIPPAVSKEVLLKKLHEYGGALKNTQYFNMVKKVLNTTSEEIGGYLIYNFKVVPSERDQDTDGNVVEYYNIIYNANYPDELPTIIPNVKTNKEIENAMNKKSKKPRDEPETEESVYFDENLQPKFRQTKKSKPKKQEKPKEELK